VEHTTPSGLSIVERVKPRSSELAPDTTPNGNDPSTVGPDNIDPGRFVMYPFGQPPPEASAWSGWPVGWQTPVWNGNSPLDQLMAKVSTAWACIDLNSRVLSTMPAYIVRDTVPQPALPWTVNPEPEVYASWEEFAKQLFTFFQMGEVFLWATARYATGFPQRFVCLRPDWVNIELDGAMKRYTLGGVDITADVLHIPYSSFPGDAHGHGPLEGAAYSLLGAAALEKYAAELAANGGVPWAVLQFPDELSSRQVDDIHGRWISARMRAMGAPAVISGGFDLKPLTFSPKDMALLDLRTYEESRVATALGVPPFLVGLGMPSGSSLTYSNVSELFSFHWRAGLRPMAQTVMAAMSNWLLPSGTGLELQRDEYVRPELDQRAMTYQTLFNLVDPVTGQRAITIDEIRALERFATPQGAAALSGGQQ
jgi:HK97 family phage portal protein